MGNVDSTNQEPYYYGSGQKWQTGSRSIRPSELRFTHDSISYQFHDGNTLEQSLRDVLNDKINVRSLPEMQVMYYEGALYVVRGNRRLYLLQMLEKFNLVDRITVKVRRFDANLFGKQYTTTCEGRYVRVRERQNTNALLTQIIEEHLNKPTPGYGGDFIIL